MAVAPVATNWQLVKAIILRKYLHVEKLGIKKRAPGSSLRLLAPLEISRGSEKNIIRKLSLDPDKPFFAVCKIYCEAV